MQRICEKRTVIFDLDGTLIDSIPGLILANQRAAVACGLPVPTGSKFRALITQSMAYSDIVRQLWPAADVHRLMAKAYEEAQKLNFREVPDARETTRILRSRGVCLALHTNRGWQDNLVPDLERAGFRTDDFHAIHTRDESVASKPDPRALQTLIQRLVAAGLLVAAKHAHVVSDAVGDAHMALACGCQFIGVLTGAATEDDFGSLRVQRAVTIVPSVTHVPKVFFPW